MGPEHPQAGDLEERDPAQSWAGPRHGGSRCGPWPLTVGLGPGSAVYQLCDLQLVTSLLWACFLICPTRVIIVPDSRGH